MRTALSAIVAMLISACVADNSHAAAPPSKAEKIVAAAKQATGGAAWDAPDGCHEEGTHGDGAITYTTTFSLQRYGMRIDSMRAGHSRSMGFNGKVQWQAVAGDKARSRSDPAGIEEGIVTDYLSINGFFFPDRFPATFTYLRAAKEADRRFDVIEITPKGGRALEVWFDRKTHLIQRVVDTHGSPAVRVEARNYRSVAGLSVAYNLDVFGPDGAVADRGVVTSFQCGLIDNAAFDPPSEP
ncbi:MAG: hypothetical protein K2W86_06625 [Sphingomonas sp.]|uniref:LolA family protein n=1 Tax=Sphingomonas sp. TaxID=28214 RepID=UPI0035A940DE|nr:hypothetical protein [Sphingomonas sp.]